MKRRGMDARPGHGDRGFPGEIAGASLKQGDADALRRILDAGFPGEIAGASLKLVDIVAALAAEEAVSPAKSPGPH